MGPRIGDIAKRLKRRNEDDERGAEMVEFALVVVLLITLLYGLITYGVILAAQSTITQAAADGARAGIIQGATATETCGSSASPVSSAGCSAVEQAATDISWMNQGACTESVNGVTVQSGPTAGSPAKPVTSCTATTGTCLSNSANTCLTVTVSYAYGNSPIFPEMPGLNVITPSTISSTNVLQLTAPSN